MGVERVAPASAGEVEVDADLGAHVLGLLVHGARLGRGEPAAAGELLVGRPGVGREGRVELEAAPPSSTLPSGKASSAASRWRFPT